MSEVVDFYELKIFRFGGFQMPKICVFGDFKISTKFLFEMIFLKIFSLINDFLHLC